MRKLYKSLTSSALALALLTGALSPSLSLCKDSGNSAMLITAAAAKSEKTKVTAPDQVVMKDYSSTDSTVTLKWKKVKGADGYRVYQEIDGSFKNILTIKKNKTSATIEGLKAAKKYAFKVRAYRTNKNSKLWGKKSKAINTVTAHKSEKDAYAVTKVKSKNDDSSVTVTWGKVKCSGYAVYLYNNIEDKWVRVAKIDGKNNTSFTFDPFTKYKGGTDCVANVTYGIQGYRFGIRPYAKDSDGTHTVYAKASRMSDPYYNIKTLEMYYQTEYEQMSELLPKAKADTPKETYNTYITSKDKKGNITSTKYTSYVSEASRQAYKDFAAKNYKKSWTDAQKLLYTINWINKNNRYDTEYKANAGGYFANVTVQKLGQCNSYNGAIAETLTILGYKGHYLQYMDSSARDLAHYRCEIKIGKKTYSFEAGEPGWMWIFSEYDEVPLNKKAK